MAIDDDKGINVEHVTPRAGTIDSEDARKTSVTTSRNKEYPMEGVRERQDTAMSGTLDNIDVEDMYQSKFVDANATDGPGLPMQVVTGVTITRDAGDSVYATRKGKDTPVSPRQDRRSLIMMTSINNGKKAPWVR